MVVFKICNMIIFSRWGNIHQTLCGEDSEEIPEDTGLELEHKGQKGFGVADGWYVFGTRSTRANMFRDRLQSRKDKPKFEGPWMQAKTYGLNPRGNNGQLEVFEQGHNMMKSAV